MNLDLDHVNQLRGDTSKGNERKIYFSPLGCVSCNGGLCMPFRIQVQLDSDTTSRNESLLKTWTREFYDYILRILFYSIIVCGLSFLHYLQPQRICFTFFFFFHLSGIVILSQYTPVVGNL